MENASKALIIAGAILISILLISLGIMIFNKNSGMVEQSNSVLDTITGSNAFKEATTLLDPVKYFNSQFEKYIGSNVSPDKAREFINAIIKNNSNPNNHRIYITLKYAGGDTIPGKGHQYTTSQLQEALKTIDDSKLYKIQMTEHCQDYPGGYDPEGYVYCMNIGPEIVWVMPNAN